MTLNPQVITWSVVVNKYGVPCNMCKETHSLFWPKLWTSRTMSLQSQTKTQLRFSYPNTISHFTIRIMLILVFVTINRDILIFHRSFVNIWDVSGASCFSSLYSPGVTSIVYHNTREYRPFLWSGASTLGTINSGNRLPWLRFGYSGSGNRFLYLFQHYWEEGKMCNNIESRLFS